MPLRAEIEQQETLERNQIKGGLEKLRKDTLHLEKKEYASATVYGSASIATLLPTFIEYLDKAVHIAKNREYLNELKNKLLTSKDNNPLFDNKSFTHNIEKAYRIVFEKHINEKDLEDVYL